MHSEFQTVIHHVLHTISSLLQVRVLHQTTINRQFSNPGTLSPSPALCFLVVVVPSLVEQLKADCNINWPGELVIILSSQQAEEHSNDIMLPSVVLDVQFKLVAVLVGVEWITEELFIATFAVAVPLEYDLTWRAEPGSEHSRVLCSGVDLLHFSSHFRHFSPHFSLQLSLFGHFLLQLGNLLVLLCQVLLQLSGQPEVQHSHASQVLELILPHVHG